MQLKKTISSIGLLCTSLSCMIGSGWLLGSYYAAKIAGPAAIISWIIGGLLIIFIALCFSELSTTFPLSGGIVMYSYFSHGEFVSFIMSWLAWLSCVAAAPSEVQATIQYASQYYPWLIVDPNNTAMLSSQGMLIAAILMLLFSYLNIIGIKTMIKFNNYLAVWKVFIPIFAAISLMSYRFEWQNFQASTFIPHGPQSIFEALSAVVVFSYLGFRESTSLAGEAKNPTKSIPISVVGSVLVCMVVYTTVQTSFIGAVSHDALADGWRNITVINGNAPIATLAMHVGIAWLASLIAIDAIVTPSGTGLVYTATTSRLLFAMSKSKNLPHIFSRLSDNGVPVNAIILNFIVGMLLFFPLSDWEKLVKFQSNAIVMAYAVGPISLISLRKQIPNIPRPFVVPVHYLFCYITFTVCNLLVYWSGWDINQYLVGGLALGVLAFLPSALKNKTITSIYNGFWLIPHFAGIILISYFGQIDGGRGFIAPGYDIIVIAIYSLIILFVSGYFRLKSDQAIKNIENINHAMYGEDSI